MTAAVFSYVLETYETHRTKAVRVREQRILGIVRSEDIDRRRTLAVEPARLRAVVRRKHTNTNTMGVEDTVLM